MRFLKEKKYTYYWHEDNDFSLHVDGENYFPLINQYIDEATDYIIIEQYLVESGEITSELISRLLAAAQRNVRIYLLFDSFGSTGLSNEDRDRLNTANIQLVFYNPILFRNLYKNLRRNHRKFICIDGVTGFTGGLGFTDEFNTRNNPQGWHDVLLQIRGPVLNDWLTSFIAIWSQYHSEIPRLINNPSLTCTNTCTQGRLVIAHNPGFQEISRSLISHIKQARHHIWLTSPYFIPIRKLRRELIKASFKGVDVRLLLAGNISDHPWVTHAYRGYYEKLLVNGVRIFEYQQRFSHAKLITCDDWTSIGSSNLDRWNRKWSMDANQEIKGKVFSQVVNDYFEQDFTQSREIILGEWKKRSWKQRVTEWLARKVVYLLGLIGKSYNP